MATNPLLLDYLFLGARIVDRVKAEVQGLEGVAGIEELAWALEATVHNAQVFVMWDGESFGGGEAARAGGGTRQIVTHTWLVLLAVRNASQVDATARHTTAGPFLSSIHKALAGWVPEGAYRPFVRTSGRKPNYRANVALYPLSFSIDLNL